jgi:hypothetical protein
MPKTKISEYSATANSNTDVASINIDEGCAPSGINNAIRAVMGHLKDFQAGTNGDSFNGPVGTGTAAAVAATTLTTSSTVTHNGGTANGVAYLNGSKVLTTGSALVFDGSNFNIGTNALFYPLAVQKNNSQLWMDCQSSYVEQSLVASTGTNIDWYQSSKGTGSFIWRNSSNTERMRLDGSGNLGLGVTPSAWSTGKAFEIGGVGRGLFSDGTNDLNIVSNAYYNGGWKYAANGYANEFTSGNGAGTFTWRQAASGTAGNAISWTTAMTLDASGRLGIGATSPATILNVSASSAGSFASNPIITIYDTNGSASARNFGIGCGSAGQLGFFGSTTQGGTPSTTALMTLDSSGNLLVGTTSVIDSSRLSVTGSGTVIASKVGTNGNYVLAAVNSSGSVVGGVIANASTTSFPTSSDYRLKENIVSMTGALATIASLNPCTYTWKATGEEGQGFIAHELQAVVPDAVVGEKDAVDEDGNPKYQGIDTSFLVATLTAAIQELKAEFDAYKATHP